jgi:hypothetical protein
MVGREVSPLTDEPGGHLTKSSTAIVLICVTDKPAAAVRFSIQCKNLRAGANPQA